jgi:molecular chaperone DnaK (HSP70)
MTKKILGIDLGTTYSCVSYINNYGQAEILANAEGERTTPSVVWFDDNRVVVGQEAKEMTNVYPDRVCSFVKRNMGNDDFAFDVDGTAYTPEHISSFILRKLVKDASQALGETLTDVVITCPAYFSFKEREATKRAGEIAGLNVLRIINEPTAAAFAYGVKPNDNSADRFILVYDLGGGTFDTTIIRISKDGLDVVCTDGDHQLGGKDWDDRLIRHLAKKFNEETGSEVELDDDMEFYYELQQKAEQMKKQLTDKTTAKTTISYQGNKTAVDVKREEFDVMTADLLNKSAALTQTVIDEAKKLGSNRIDQILLVGGSSRMPQVANRIKAEFGKEPLIFEPDEAVAKGAAVIGNNVFVQTLIKKKIKTGLLLDAAKKQVADENGYTLESVNNAIKRARNVTSKTFGITVVESYDANNQPQLACNNLIYRNTPLPVEVKTQYATIAKDQQIVVVELVENGEDAPPTGSPEQVIALERTTTLWNGDLPVKPNLPQYSPVDVTFRINENGQLIIEAFDPASGGKIRKAIPEIDNTKKQELDIISQKSRELVVE